MGNHFQVIVDKEAQAEEAFGLAAHIREWLLGEGIIEGKTQGCVPGRDAGYPPGPNYALAIARPYARLREMAINGLAIITGRTVFECGQGGFYLACDACSCRFEPPDAWSDAVAEWYHRKGPGLLACRHCGATQPIAEWRHDPPWGFGHLGFKFWNRPPLKQSFVEAVATRLGHKVVVVFGKL
jgi:hypothetical protein